MMEEAFPRIAIQCYTDSSGTVQTMTKEDGTVLTYVYNLANKYLVTTINVTDAPEEVVGTTQQTFAYDGAARVVQSTDNNGICEVTQSAIGGRNTDKMVTA